MATGTPLYDASPVTTTVLIVDDHAPFRELAAQMLSSAGFDVLGGAADGTSAIDAARRLRPDLVLLDVELPDIDGFAVAQALDRAEHAPVVVLTSSRDAADYPARLRSSPARGFIAKSDLSASALSALVEA